MSEGIESVRDYLASRRRDSPKLHNVPIRMPPSMHTHLKIIAEERGESMNTIVLMMIQRGYSELVKDWEDGTNA